MKSPAHATSIVPPWVIQFLCNVVIGAGAVSSPLLFLDSATDGLQSVLSGLFVVGVVYALVWILLSALLKGRSRAAWLIVGALSMYIASLVTVVGIWYIFVGIYFWWVFIPLGVLSGTLGWWRDQIELASKVEIIRMPE